MREKIILLRTSAARGCHDLVIIDELLSFSCIEEDDFIWMLTLKSTGTSYHYCANSRFPLFVNTKKNIFSISLESFLCHENF